MQTGPAPSNLTVSYGSNVGYLASDLTNTTTITVESGAHIEIYTCDADYTLAADLVFADSGSSSVPGQLSISSSCTAPQGLGGVTADSINAQPLYNFIVSGNITLQTDGDISGFYTTNSSLKLTGTVTKNGHNLKLTASAGTKVMGSGVGANLQVAQYGLIAPGNSPGIYSSGNLTLDSGSGYQFELGGSAPGTGYDQIDVTGTVTLTNPELIIQQWNGYQPTPNQTFIIINNDGIDAISGTFNGITEGAQFTKAFNGVDSLFSVSYVGGDGNDVVLTYLGAVPAPSTNTPGAPNTAIRIVTSNPLLVIISGLVTTITIVLIGLRLRSTK